MHLAYMLAWYWKKRKRCFLWPFVLLAFYSKLCTRVYDLFLILGEGQTKILVVYL
jgi:ABC-type spermidine/putrescine transport system permease subunit I